MAEIDYLMIALLGFCTGLGTTMGGEFAKDLKHWLANKIKSWLGKHGIVKDSVET